MPDNNQTTRLEEDVELTPREIKLIEIATRSLVFAGASNGEFDLFIKQCNQAMKEMPL